MFLNELAEPTLLVIYPGRFQPFHKGHHAVYEYLTGKFGRNNVYIATSNKTDNLKSPFTYAEKAYFMQLTGVPADRIVQATNPYQIESILSTSNIHVSNPANTVVIFAVSEKDMAEDPRFSFKTKQDGSAPYFQPLKDIKDTQSMKEHGYIMTVPTFDFTVAGAPMRSGTELRKLYADSDEAGRQAIVKDLFGRYTREAEQIMSSKIPTEAEPVAETKLEEGWQDFNKVEPYEVCLAGRPVKQFDYYADARRFHDNWKAKLYREGNKEKADKITLNPVLKEFAPSPGFSGDGEPDRFPRIPQKFHKGDIVWVTAPKVKSRSHFPGDAPAVVLGSYDDQYGDDMVYVDVDLDDPDLSPEDRKYYTDEAKRKAAQEHQYDIFLLHKNEVGETAWYPESDLTAVPAGTNVEGLFTKGNAAPWAKVPAKIKKIFATKLGQQNIKEFAPGGTMKPPAPPTSKKRDPWEDDDRSQLLMSIKQLLDKGAKIDSYLFGARGHITGVSPDYFGFTFKKLNQPHSKSGFVRPMDGDDDDSYMLKMIKPGYYQLWDKSIANAGEQGMAEGATVAYVVTYFDTKTGDRGESTVSALTQNDARDKIVQLMHERGYDVVVTGVRSASSVDECAGTGVVASKKQANDPRYKTSLTKDVRPGQIQKNLRAFNLAEEREPYQQAIDKLTVKWVGRLTDEIDELKNRINTEKLAPEYKEKMKQRIEKLDAERAKLMFNP